MTRNEAIKFAIATIINDDKIDESIIVADGYTVRIKPKAN